MALTSLAQNKRYAVIGLGLSGLSCIRYLVGKQASVVAMDTRVSPPALETIQTHFPQVPLYLGGLNQEALKWADELVVSPGFPFQEGSLSPYQKPNQPLIGDIELFAREVGSSVPIIGITGSNGKSTVTTLLGEMAKAAGLNVKVGGNLGYPALDLLDHNKAVDLYVLELSSFQLELTHSLKARAGVVLNICDDHLDRHKTLSRYIAAKQHLYRCSQVALINRDDILSFKDAPLPKQLMSFGLNPPCDTPVGDKTVELAQAWGVQSYQGQNYLTRGHIRLLPVSKLFDPCNTHIANSLAALALASTVNLPLKPALSVLSSFKGLPHRCEKVGLFSGITWYNDSKATNVGAALASIQSIGAQLNKTQRLILIAGGHAKGADFSPLVDPVARHVANVILLGRDAKQLGAVLSGSTSVHYVLDMPEAVRLAATLAQPGDSVLLAPACSSQDGLFENFEHRGRVFVEAVQNQTTHHE